MASASALHIPNLESRAISSGNLNFVSRRAVPISSASSGDSAVGCSSLNMLSGGARKLLGSAARPVAVGSICFCAISVAESSRGAVCGRCTRSYVPDCPLSNASGMFWLPSVYTAPPEPSEKHAEVFFHVGRDEDDPGVEEFPAWLLRDFVEQPFEENLNRALSSPGEPAFDISENPFVEFMERIRGTPQAMPPVPSPIPSSPPPGTLTEPIPNAPPPEPNSIPLPHSTPMPEAPSQPRGNPGGMPPVPSPAPPSVSPPTPIPHAPIPDPVPSPMPDARPYTPPPAPPVPMPSKPPMEARPVSTRIHQHRIMLALGTQPPVPGLGAPATRLRAAAALGGQGFPAPGEQELVTPPALHRPGTPHVPLVEVLASPFPSGLPVSGVPSSPFSPLDPPTREPYPGLDVPQTPLQPEPEVPHPSTPEPEVPAPGIPGPEVPSPPGPETPEVPPAPPTVPPEVPRPPLDPPLGPEIPVPPGAPPETPPPGRNPEIPYPTPLPPEIPPSPLPPPSIPGIDPGVPEIPLPPRMMSTQGRHTQAKG